MFETQFESAQQTGVQVGNHHTGGTSGTKLTKFSLAWKKLKGISGEQGMLARTQSKLLFSTRVAVLMHQRRYNVDSHTICLGTRPRDPSGSAGAKWTIKWMIGVVVWRRFSLLIAQAVALVLLNWSLDALLFLYSGILVATTRRNTCVRSSAVAQS